MRTSTLLRALPLAVFGMILVVEIVGTARSISAQGAEEFAARSDFRSFLAAADIVAAGQADVLYDLDAQLDWQQRRFRMAPEPSALLVFASPPFVASSLWFFAELSTPAAYWVALALNGTLLVAILTLLGLLLGPSNRSARVTLVLGAASFLPMWTALWQGQLSLVALLGVVCSGLAFRGGRDFLAGLSLSLLLCKPHLLVAPLLFLLLQRRQRAVLGLALGAGMAGLASLVTVGPDGVAAWMALGRELMDVGDLYGIHPRRMYTLRSLLHLLAQTDDLGPVLLPWLVASVLVLAASAWFWRRPLAGRRFGVALGASVVLGLLISPHGYKHDLVLAVPAALGLAAAAIELRPGRWAGWALATGGLLWAIPWFAGDPLPPPVVVPVLLVLSGLGVSEMLRPAPCSIVREDAAD